MEIMGRSDFTIKIRGFKVAFGMVEQNIADLDKVTHTLPLDSGHLLVRSTLHLAIHVLSGALCFDIVVIVCCLMCSAHYCA